MVPKPTTALFLLFTIFAYGEGSCDNEMQAYKDENLVIGSFNSTALIPEVESLADLGEFCTFGSSLDCTAEFAELLDDFEAACDEVGGTYVTYDLESTDGCTFSDFGLAMSITGVDIPQCLGPSCDAQVRGDEFAVEVNEGLVEFGVVGCMAEITDVKIGGPSNDDYSDSAVAKASYLSALFIAISVALLQ